MLCTAELGAQQHLVDEGGTVTACDFYFLDDGGALGDAGTGVDHSTTFCPETAGGDLTFSFSTFALSAGDTLFLWRGDDAAGPPDESHTGSGLVGVDVGNGVGSDNPSGCMTWRFVSGGAGGSNWAALVSCSAPCSRPVASVAAALDGVAQSDVVETCLGTEVQFDAGATVLPTTSGAAGWLWDFGDGSGGDLGQAPVHAYSEPGVYSVQLTVTDSTGCSSVNSIGLSVHVAAPIAIDVPATGPLVCEGGTAVLGLGPGGVTTTPVASQPNASFGAGIVIPDSVGQAFTSAITFSGFQYGQAVADSGDLVAVNLNLEHSFILDLVVELECPNGNTMVLQGWPGGAGGCINAGLPVTADDPPEPGVGFDYSWSPGETVDWQAAAVSLLPTPTSGCASSTPPLPAGSYAATGDWTALEGCPINGTWTLHLMDTQPGDNGFLFGWSIDFAGDITPEQTTFEATVGTGCDSAYWAPSGNWDFPESTIGDCAGLVVEPSVAGTYGYVFTAVDAFGCTADTTVHITVEPGLDFALSSDLFDATAGVDAAVCEDVPFVLQAHPLSTVPSGTQYNWVVNGTSTGLATAMYVDPDPALGTYEVIFQATVSAPPPINGVCQFEWMDTIEVVPLPTLSLDIPNACSNVPVDLTITATGEDPSWQWTLVADGLDTVSSVTWDHPNLSLLPAGEYALYGALSDVHGCGAADVEVFTVHPAADAGFALDAVCAGEPLPFTLDSPDDYTAPNTASTWSLMGGGALSDEGGHLGTAATGGGGFPQVILTMVSDNPDGSTCTASSSEFAMIHSLPVVAVYGPDVACDGEDALWLAASTIPFPGQVVSTDWVVSGQLDFSQDGLLPLLLEAPALGQYTVGFTAVSDQGCVAEHILEFEVQPIPDAGFTLPAEVCQDSPVALDLASADSTGHIWTANGAVLEVAGLEYPESLSALPGTVDVEHIATLGSCSDTAYASLEVAPLPEAIVAGPSAACAGDAVQWTDASVNPTPSPLTIQWTPDPGAALPPSTEAMLDFGTPAPGLYGVSLSVTTASGCSDSTADALFVGVMPLAEFQLEDVCAGGAIPLDLTDPDSHGTADAQWWWNGMPMDAPTGGTLPDAVSGAAGLQTIEVALAMVYPEITCSSGHDATVQVHAQPEAGIIAPGDFCAGPDAVFEDATAIDAGITVDLTWTLDDGSGGADAGQDPWLLLPMPAPGTYAVTLTASTPAGCSSTAADSLTVFASPDAGFTLPLEVCQGSPVQLDTYGPAEGGTWTANGVVLTPVDGLYPAALTSAPGNVTVVHTVDLGNCSDTAAAVLAVAPMPDAIATGPTAACTGDAVQWHDASFNPTPDPLTISWTPAPGTVLPALAGPTLDFGMPEAGTYGMTLTVTTASGCVDSTAAAFFVGSTPVPGFTLEAVCAGEAIPLALDDLNSLATSDAQWLWNGAPLAVPSSGALPEDVSAMAGAQEVTLTLDAAYPQITCTAQHSVSVEVYAQPEAAILAPADFCAGPDAAFTDASMVDAGVDLDLFWTLDEGGGAAPSGTDADLLLPTPAPGTYAVSLTASTPDGCSSTASDTLTVFASPDAGFTLPTGVCQGNAVEVVTDGPADSGDWSANGLPLTPVDGLYPESMTDTPGTLTLVHIVDLGNCSDTASAILEVYPRPEAAIAGPTAACTGDAVQWLDASVNVTGDPLTLEWSPAPGTWLPPTTGPMLDFGTPGVGVYGMVLTATTSQGCADSAAAELFVGTTPDPGFQLDAVCAGQPVPLTLDDATGYAVAESQWWWNGVLLEVTDVGSLPDVVSDLAGVQELVLSLSLAHPQITCSAAQTAVVEVHAQPDADFIAPADFCAGPDAVFTDATAIDAGVEYNLQWTLDDSTGFTVSDDEPDLWLAAPAPGVYAVNLTATTAAGCTSSAADTVVVYAAPDAAFSLPSAVCEGSTLPVPTVGTPGTLSWTLDGEPVSTAGGAFAPAMTDGWGSRTVGVTVTLGSGPSQCEDSHEEFLWVEALPVVDFTGDAAACAGEVAQWQEACTHPQGLSLATAWTLDGEASGVGDALIFGSDTPGQYTIGLTASSPAGCAAQTGADITFEALPVPAFALTEACSGSPILWEPQGEAFFGIPSWTWGDIAITMEGDSLPAVVSDFPGEQTLILTLAETYPSGITCSSTDSATTVVHPTPTADIVGPQDLCAGDTAAFAAVGTTPVPSDLTYAWSWDGTAVGTATGNDLTLSELPTGTLGVQLVVTTTGSCAAMASTSMEVVGLPDADFTLPESACVGSVVSIGSGTGDDTTLDSTWTLDAMPLMWTAPGIPAAVTEVPGIHVVALTVALTSGTVTCTSSAQEAIEVHAVPEADWDVDPEACSGLMLAFEAESQIATGVPLTSTWSFIGEDTLTVEGATLALGALEPGQYTVQFDVVGAGGCATALEEQLTVHTSPDAAFDAANACVGEAIQVVPGDADDFATGSVAWTWNGNPTTVDGGWMDPMVSAYSGPQMLGSTVTTVFPSGYSCSDSHMTTVEVWPNPQAGWDVPAGLCEGEATAFTGSSTIAGGGALTTLWSWNAEGATPQWEEGEVVDPGFLVVGTQAVSMVVESEWGCRDSLYSTFDVHPLPVADFSMEATCAGGPVEWMALEPQSWTGAASWTWNGSPFDPGTSGMGTGAGGVLPDDVSAAPGIQWIGVGLSEMHGDGTVCSASAMEPVEVYPQPAATWDIVPGWCAGSSASFTADAGVEVADLVWTLSGPQGTTGYLGNDAELGLLPAGTYNLQLTAGTPDGCADSLSATVKVHPNPAVAFNLEPVCAGAAIPVNWSGSNTDSLQATWTWNGGPIEVTGPTLPGAVSATPGLQWIQLAASQEFPTGATCTAAALESVDVYPVPVADVAADTLWCAGEEAIVHAAPSGEGDLTCSWATPFGAQFGPVWTLPESALGTVPATLTVTSEGGCSGSRNFNVRIDPLPEVVLSDTLLMGCAPFAPELHVATSGYNGLVLSTVWSWPEGEEEAAGWSEEIGVASWPVTCTVMAGDADLMCSGIAYATVVGLEVPEAAFTMFPESPTVRQREVEFTAEEPGNASAFIWTVNGAVESTQPLLDYAFAPYFGDDYTVCLEVVTPFGCTDETCREVEVIGEVQVYVPSGFTPDNDGINDLFRPSVAPLDQVEDYRFEVYNRWGELVFFTEDPEEGWNGSYPGGSHFAGNEVFNWVIVLDTALELPRRMMGQVSAIR